jgi:hypothetical protein
MTAPKLSHKISSRKLRRNVLRLNDFIDVFSVDPEKDSRDQGLRRIQTRPIIS